MKGTVTKPKIDTWRSERGTTYYVHTKKEFSYRALFEDSWDSTVFHKFRVELFVNVLTLTRNSNHNQNVKCHLFVNKRKHSFLASFFEATPNSVFLNCTAKTGRLSFAGLLQLFSVRWRFIYLNATFHRGITKPFIFTKTGVPYWDSSCLTIWSAKSKA